MDDQFKARRAQFFIDGDLQGTLLRRVIGYWLIALVVMSAAVFMVRLLWGASLDQALLMEVTKTLLPSALLSLLPLPFILRDLIRTTHRFAGPMLRVRRGLAELAQQGKSAPIVPRQGDAWGECIADFNQIASREASNSQLQ